MDKNTPKTSFSKWTGPINVKKLLAQVNNLEQDKYTKKLTTEAYIKLITVFLHQEYQKVRNLVLNTFRMSATNELYRRRV